MESSSTQPRHRVVNVVFAAPIFLGAFLLFQVQPLIGKFILPWFGGATGVWTVCLLFFQIALLGGYAYAHGLGLVRSLPVQIGIHLALVVSAVLFLPIRIDPAWKPAPQEDPTWSVLGLLATSIGVPYVVLAATSPLLQSWYRRATSGEPYRLYALSNVGSLFALLTFPFVFEPLLARRLLANVWSIGFLLFAVTMIGCAVALHRRKCAARIVPSGELHGNASRWNLVFWILLPTCASSLLLSITNKMCQDIAVVPFLWVLPLCLYLLTFIISFDSPTWYSRSIFGIAFALFAGATCYVLMKGPDVPIVAQILIHSGTLFSACMILHGELYRMRPVAERLTSYYLAIALGGALGGAFVGLIAPVVFSAYFELHWTLIVSVVLLLAIHARENTWLRFGNIATPIWALLGTGLIVLSGTLWMQAQVAENNVILRTRNFYGVLRVFDYPPKDGSTHTRRLNSGEITHGEQFVNPLYSQMPTTYYHEESGIGAALEALAGTTNRRIGAVGLGIGTLASYTTAGDTIRFYEINPETKDLAEKYFFYLQNATGKVEVVFGDARLSLEREPPQNFHLLVLDAFSSDSIPVHLLTREAVEGYLKHLRSSGVLAIHITNRHLDLVPVVDGLMRHFKLHAAFIQYDASNSENWKYSCKWVLLTRQPTVLESEAILSLSEELPKRRNATLWTDDYASLLPLIALRED